jgi:hypothetical protein
MSLPYLIKTGPYSVTCGGTRVMWALQSWLEIKGQITQVTEDQFAAGEFIAVIPEITPNEHAPKCKRVVRYVLNKPGVIGGPANYPPDHMVFVIHRIFDVWGLPENRVLYIPTLDLHVFNDQRRLRSQVVWYEGKGRRSDRHPLGAMEITRAMMQDQSWLAETLNTSSALYSYDPISALHDIARLCGCPVVMCNDLYSRADYEGYELPAVGLRWYSELSGVPQIDTDQFRKVYQAKRNYCYHHAIDSFIDQTQEGL